MFVNEDANTANRKDCTKCLNKGGKNKSLKNVTIPNPKPSKDIRNFFKRTEYQRGQVTPETEGNVPSNAIKSDLIVIDYNYLLLYLLCYLHLVCIKILLYCDNISIFVPDFSMRHFLIFMKRLYPTCYSDTVILIFCYLVPYLLYHLLPSNN